MLHAYNLQAVMAAQGTVQEDMTNHDIMILTFRVRWQQLSSASWTLHFSNNLRRLTTVGATLGGAQFPTHIAADHAPLEAP